MPHTIIEYSVNLERHHDVDALVGAIHDAMIGLDLARLGAYRTRATPREHYRIADGDSNHAFVAITIRIGPGRTADNKKEMIETVLDTAEATLDADGGPLRIAWSAEVQEIDADFRENRNYVADHSPESPDDAVRVD